MLKNTLVALFLALFLAGCSDSSPLVQDSKAEKRQTEAAIDKASELNAVIATRIYIRQKELESMPGRTGILAEKPLYSAFAEEIIIRDFFQDQEGGFFLDVGAAWAIQASNTYYLEKNLGWTGIAVDALIDYAPEWEQFRPNSKFVNFLVSDKTGGEGVFYKSSLLGLSSTKKWLAKGGLFGGDDKPTEIRVPMITLDDLLDREGVEKIDLISMDIEGHEPKAFAGFDIERFAPELLVVEGKNEWVNKYLEGHGYRQIERYEKFDSVNRYYQRVTETSP